MALRGSRSKGFTWLATQPDTSDEWPEDATARKPMRQELVFIGQDLRVEELKRALDACLVTDQKWRA
ncbi:hypothetical protein GPECTOR_3g94 [Gonium pectorale]|uniref:CobW C-terminal domain-containing protein n=1 Tax=Gonium pectorale TaxID=33097 RepID=A0A150H046_GONPE|nr:hypothetical protein GPECTOR_3g94 [Gonium pectorale]|eukprot:KXZ55445.1 hypothetical protein GPECTOR_3g94 [Gonium pectorale]